MTKRIQSLFYLFVLYSISNILVSCDGEPEYNGRDISIDPNAPIEVQSCMHKLKCGVSLNEEAQFLTLNCQNRFLGSTYLDEMAGYRSSCSVGEINKYYECVLNTPCSNLTTEQLDRCKLAPRACFLKDPNILEKVQEKLKIFTMSYCELRKYCFNSGKTSCDDTDQVFKERRDAFIKNCSNFDALPYIESCFSKDMNDYIGANAPADCPEAGEFVESDFIPKCNKYVSEKCKDALLKMYMEL